MPHAHGTYGVSGQASPDELAVLDLADEFRRELCAIHHERHRLIVDTRNATFPRLWAALVEYELISAKIYEIESAIKALHAAKRDRNVRTPEQEAALTAMRERRTEVAAIIRSEKAAWIDWLKAYRKHFGALADWKKVKTLAKRRVLYDAIEWPAGMREFGAAMLALDVRERELSGRYQELGLHSAIRGEIVAASKPKLGKSGPGMRYEYRRPPQPEPWRKIILQFVGGVKYADLLAGKNRSLSITPDDRGRNRYRTSHQIGTAKVPRRIEYTLHLQRPINPEEVIQRWTLVVTREQQRHFSGRGWFERTTRSIVPVVASAIVKPQGDGVLTYSLSWTRKKFGVQIAHFYGDHVDERLIIPAEIVERRMAAKEAEAECDIQANVYLSSVGELPPAGKRQGVDALETYVAANPTDNAAGNLLDECELHIHQARRAAKKALRTIEKIYETVALRVCSLHGSIVLPTIDLKKMKQYNKRDLLKDDVIPLKSREIMHAVAPGKLHALLKGYGLPVASDNVAIPPNTEETDLFSTWVAGRSQSTASTVGVS